MNAIGEQPRDCSSGHPVSTRSQRYPVNVDVRPDISREGLRTKPSRPVCEASPTSSDRIRSYCQRRGSRPRARPCQRFRAQKKPGAPTPDFFEGHWMMQELMSGFDRTVVKPPDREPDELERTLMSPPREGFVYPSADCILDIAEEACQPIVFTDATRVVPVEVL